MEDVHIFCTSVSNTSTGILYDLFMTFRDSSAVQGSDISEPLVTFPDPDTPPPVTGTLILNSSESSPIDSSNSLNDLGDFSQSSNITSVQNLSNESSSEMMKFEQKKVTSASKTKVCDIFIIKIWI